jgi:alcohol dehydrogenase class IV
MKEWEFATSGRIVFGVGAAARLGELAAPLGRKALLVTGRDPKRFAAVIGTLGAAGVEHVGWRILGEPTVEEVEQAVDHAREAGCDVVIGLGGGSAVDAAKAIAALLTNPPPVLDYLEVIGKGRSLAVPALPIVAVPTTAGTGSEVTRNAVLKSSEHRVKVSLRSPHMLPTVTLVDPALTRTVPSSITADTGLDALTQVIEPYVSIAANPLTDAICREGIRRGARSLRRAFSHCGDIEARTDLSITSLMGGLALANAKLGAVHGFAGPLGGKYPAPHGAVCARLLPGVMEANVTFARERAETDAWAAEVLDRYQEVARLLTGRPDATIEAGCAWVRTLVDDLGIRPLSAFGLRHEDVPGIVEESMRSSSMKGNPFVLPADVLTRVLEQALSNDAA